MLASLLAAALLTAAAPAPLDVVKSGNESVQKLVSKKDASVAQLSQVVERFVDFGELARRALGPQWDKLTAAQRQEFSTEMVALLRANYAKKALDMGRTQVGYGEQSIQGNEASVATRVYVNRDRFPIQYKLFRSGAKAEWRIYDVVADGHSMLEGYQEQFRKLMATKGFDGLMATLKSKRAQLERSTR